MKDVNTMQQATHLVFHVYLVAKVDFASHKGFKALVRP